MNIWIPGLIAFAQDDSVGPKALYKAFQPNGNPTFLSLTSVIKELGLRLEVGVQNAVSVGGR